jgi:sigma-B regulation protein RsbU (phosphoserine phosphatase)
MKSRYLLYYIPLFLLFILSAVVYVQHARPIVSSLVRIASPSGFVRYPFELQKGAVAVMLPEAESAGMRTGDVIVAVDGVELRDGVNMTEQLNAHQPGDTVVYTVRREGDSGPAQIDIPVEGVKLTMTFKNVATNFATTVLFLLCLPALSFVLGFYVAFVRPRDPLAWVLLFLLIGIGSIAIEGRSEGTLIRTFQESAMNFLGLWMLLFGIYFPERLDFDRRHPWAKWMLIVPVGAFGVLTLVEQVGRLVNVPLIWQTVNDLTDPYDRVSTVLTMVSMGCFFAALAVKSATLENRDSRRRLRILYFGTSAALLPALFIIIYRLASGKEGGFFELVPTWLAILALVAMLLFPLTMAYVIVVQRAMDVSVVIRQGLQYAFAKNGVLVVQIVLSFLVILIAASFVSDNTTNRPQKITFIALGITFVFIIRRLADALRTWTDKKFFREAYNAEQILSDLSEDVRTMVETRPLLEIVAGKISESLHVPQVSLLLRSGNKFLPAYSIGFDVPPPVALTGDSRAIRKLGDNKHIVLYDDMTEVTSIPTVSLDEREQFRELNSQVLLPVAAKNQLSGIISLSPKRSEEPYTATDLRLLRSVAAQTGIALENSRLTAEVAAEAAQKERLNAELEIAREVQERLFPQELPAIEGLDYYGACRPALGVGGDYYDFLELQEKKFGIAIGDISGKGIGASLMMASLQASLRGQTLHFGDDLAGLMKQVNGLLYETSTTNRYATFFYAQYDPRSKHLTYVNAGHNPPFLLRSGGEVVRLEDGGPVIGMLPSMLVSYSQGEIDLRSGDIVVGFTDGISEAMDPNEEEWGEDAMLEFLKTINSRCSAEILAKTVSAADVFASGAKQHDDMTMIVVKVL